MLFSESSVEQSSWLCCGFAEFGDMHCDSRRHDVSSDEVFRGKNFDLAGGGEDEVVVSVMELSKGDLLALEERGWNKCPCDWK